MRVAGGAARRFAAVFISVVLTVGMCPATALAGDVAPASQTVAVQSESAIASGTSGTCTWAIDSEGTLTVRPADGDVGTLGTWRESSGVPWRSHSSEIVSVAFEGSVKAQVCCGMFSGCSRLASIDLSGLDLSNVSDFSSMFYGCASLESFDISQLNGSKAANLSAMFASCTSLESIDLSQVDVAASDVSGMFERCSSLARVEAEGFDMSNVTAAQEMFWGCTSLESLDLSGWDTSRVKKAFAMFKNCTSLTSIDLTGWDTSSMTSVYEMFAECPELTSIYVDSGWYLAEEAQKSANSYSMFLSCDKLVGGNGTAWQNGRDGAPYAQIDAEGAPGYLTLKPLYALLYDNGDLVFQRGDAADASRGSVAVTYADFEADGSHPWNSGLGYNENNSTIKRVVFEDSVEPSTLEGWFARCVALESIEGIGKLRTGKATSMASMFGYCPKLASLDLSSFDTSQVTSMRCMFQRCGALAALDLRSFDTSRVTDMNSMFDRCAELASLDISSFVTSEVTDMANMFYACTSLPSPDVSKFDTSKVTSMHGMFWASPATELDLTNFDTSKVTEFGEMFCNCKKLVSLDLSSFSSSSVAGADNFRWMFDSCDALASVKFGSGWKPIANETLSGEALPAGKWKDSDGTVHATSKDFVDALGGASVKGTWLNGAGTWAKKEKAALVSLSLVESSVTYDGAAHKPVAKSVVARSGVPADSDYTLTYWRGSKQTSDFTSAGEITVKATGVGEDFSGTASATFTIKAAALSSVKLASASATYDGKAHKPAVESVSWKGGSVGSSEYVLTYWRTGKKTDDFTQAGTITVKVEGRGNFTGAKSVTFTISPAALSSVRLAASSAVYDGKAHKPIVKSVTAKSGTPKSKISDYALTFWRGRVQTDDFTSAGTITVKAQGKLNFAGTATATFTIAKAAPKITAKATSKAVKAKAAKKKAQAINLGAKSSSGGKLSYKVLKSNKKVAFKAGKATLAKGAKKGAYSVKVRVTSAAKGNYKQGYKDFTITFKVKG